MRTYLDDREKFDRYIPLVQKYLSIELDLPGHLIKVSSNYQDTKEATDLLAMTIDKAIGVRLRDYYYYTKWWSRDDFTMRLIRPDKEDILDTELKKVIEEGFCDYNFYGFLNQKMTDLVKYYFIDYEALRREFHTISLDEGLYTVKNNKDDSSALVAFHTKLLPHGIIKNVGWPLTN